VRLTSGRSTGIVIRRVNRKEARCRKLNHVMKLKENLDQDWVCNNCNTKYGKNMNQKSYRCDPCNENYCYNCLYVAERYINTDPIKLTAAQL
jgi:transposase-like protein